MSLNQNQNDYNGKPESGMEQLQVEKGKLWEMRIKRKWTNLNWVDFFSLKGTTHASQSTTF